MLFAALSLVGAPLASAAGTTANSISASSAPSAASDGGSYAASATASSKDTVAITLSSTSTGCTISSGKVSFTGAGTCVVDFNDAGNATYAAAVEVVQSIKVYAANVISVSNAPVAGGAGGSYSPGASATSGDDVVRSLASSSTGCTLSSGKVSFTGLGTCKVDFNDVGNGAFAAAKQVTQSVTVHSGNYITASTAPAAGAIHGTYSAKATATSGDKVVITLDGTSSGCSIDKAVVTFTGNGMCRVDFNDAGNGAFAAAKQVQQEITVGTGGLVDQTALVLTSTRGSYGHVLILTSSGGSGTGALTYAVTTIGTAGCSINAGTISSTRVGTCTVTVSKAADDTYFSAHSSATTVAFAAHYPKSPRAIRLSSAVWTGRTVLTSIIGTGFYGQPHIISNSFGTRVAVSHDNGRVLTIHVTVAAGSAGGVHTFTLIFANGERTSLRYNQR
ncbi:MAG: hypothetical protein ABSC34_11935 [Acidimicrobiales bacterium]